MNGVRPLALILAVLTGCVALATMWLHFAGGQASLPAEVVEGAVLQQDCVDDVSVTISSQWGVIERTTYTLKDPPDYKAGDDIGIYYDVTNSSCHNVTVTVELKGSVSESTIHNTDATDDMACLEGCTINAGDTLNGNVGWDLSKHPNANSEKVIATVTVTAPAGFVDADTSNNTVTSEQWINIVNEEPDPAPDIAVKSVKAPSDEYEAVVGDSVVFTVVVQNEGDADAETTVILDHGADTSELASETVSVLADGPEKTVTLSWDTNGADAGEHTLRALAQTEGDGNTANDSRTEAVTLLERSVDVAVKSVTASATEALVGDTVDFTVTLANDGNVPAPWPQVSLFDANAGEDAEPIASKEADTVAVDGTETVTVSWDTDEADAGTYSLRVVAAVAGDDDSSNDSATVSLTLHDPVDVELSLTSIVASTAVKGSSVSVPFTVTNSGENDTGAVVVNLYVAEVGQDQTTEDTTSDGTDDAEEEDDEPTATTTISTLAVDGSTSGTLTWDTAAVAVGDYELEVVAEIAGDIDDTNNSVSANIEIRNWLLLKNVSPTSAAAVSGDTVEFTAQVENVGQGEVTSVTVGLYESGGNEALASATIDSVAAGDTEDVSITWNTAGQDLGQVELFVVAGADGHVADENDSQSVNVTIRNPIVLSSAVPASTDHIAGIPVSINVQILNESVAEVTNVEVKLDGVEDCGDEEDKEKEKGCATIVAIPAGETGTAVLEWDTAGVEPGDHELKIVASIAGYGSDANDGLPLTVTLRAPVVAVALTGASINRNMAAIGQTLEVTATITNHGEVPVEAPVSLYLVAQLEETTAASTATSSLIEPGSSAEVTLKWDSTGEEVGTHTLKVVAELPGDTTSDDNEEILKVELFQSAFDGTYDVEGCVEDVRVKVTGLADLGGEKRLPPNYYVGETLRATYSLYNFSCQTDATLVVTMRGPEGHVINDASALCFSNCVIPFGGKAEGEIMWVIPTLPALSEQPISASITVVSPSDFVDANEANNSSASTDRMNIVHPGDLVVHLGEQNDNKVSTRQSLTGPEFGTVDVRLVSADPLQAALPFAADSVAVAVAVANDGPTAEPTTVRFVLASEDGADPHELHRHTMVIPTGQTLTETVEVPLRGVLPGVHTVAVLLSAAVDRSPDNNAASVEITRMAPLVNVEIADVAVSPDMLILGDDATVSLAVRNESEIALPLNLELYVDDDAEPTGTNTIDELAPDGQSEELIAWRVPAAARMLGKHTLRLMASSEEFGAVANTDKDVTFHIDAEILRINALPTETAMRGEEVAIEVEVRNNGPATVNVPITLHFPSETKSPETRRPAVPAASTETARFTWKTGNYAAGEHVLVAKVPDEHNIASGETSMELPFRLTPLAVTATIVDVSVYPETPSVGEPVSMAVTVRNDGPVATRIPITLHFPPGGRQPDSKKPRLDPGEAETVVFEWLTGNYRPGTHRFLIEAAAVNSPQRRFTIDLLPTVENVAIVGMGTYPAETAMVGEPVEVWIDVRNHGPVTLNVPVRLTFPSASKRPEVRSPRVGPGETATVWFEWKTSNYEPGDHTLRAEILLDNNITLGSATEEIRFALAPVIFEATIVDVAVHPEEPRVGEPVTMTVTVRNDGRTAANIPVTLHFPSSEKQPETRRPRVEPGAVGAASFEWRTSRYEPGIHDFRVEAASDRSASQRFEVELLPPIVNVAMVGIGSDPSETAVKGQTVKIWVDVINNGPSALSVPIQLSFPSDQRNPERKSATMDPGETTRVEFTWKTANYNAGVHTLTATLLADYNATELDTTATIQIRLISPRLIASIVNISWSPDSPVVGEPVAITVTVRNDGLVAANIPVTLNFPSGGKQPETQRPHIDAGAIGTISFTWLTSRYQPGDHAFVVEAASIPPSMHEFTVELLPPIVNVAIVGMGSEPGETAVKGQAVKIWVDVINSGPSALDVPVQLSFPSSDKQPERKSPRIEPGETARVEFTWKTANYDPGIHTLTAELLVEYNKAERDTSATIQIRLVPAQLIASIAGISWSPESPVVGEPVRITVTVRNDGLVAANIPVTLHFPSGDKQPETRRPRIDPGATDEVSFTWRTSRYEPGDHVFRVQIPGVAGAVRTFEIELRPPEVDFAVADFQTPDPLHPIVKGDWVEITVVVQNQGPYAGRGTVYLTNAADLDTMYEQSSNLEPGELRDVEFTWKTLRYPVGGYELLARVEAEYDTASDNDESDRVSVHLLTDRDITVGFGNNARPAVFAETTSEAALGIAPRYSNDIQIAGVDRFTIDRPMSPASDSPIGVAPKPTGGRYDPARMYWQWRSAQISPWECVRYQREIGESLPRAVVCPKAPALVR